MSQSWNHHALKSATNRWPLPSQQRPVGRSQCCQILRKGRTSQCVAVFKGCTSLALVMISCPRPALMNEYRVPELNVQTLGMQRSEEERMYTPCTHIKSMHEP